MTTVISAYQRLAEQIAGGDSKVVPRILETLVDENEAKLLLAAEPPGTVDELARRSGLDTGAAEALIDPLFRKGLLFKSRRGGGTCYYRVRELLQVLDATTAMHDPPPQLMELWRELANEWEGRNPT